MNVYEILGDYLVSGGMIAGFVSIVQVCINSLLNAFTRGRLSV